MLDDQTANIHFSVAFNDQSARGVQRVKADTQCHPAAPRPPCWCEGFVEKRLVVIADRDGGSIPIASNEADPETSAASILPKTRRRQQTIRQCEAFATAHLPIPLVVHTEVLTTSDVYHGVQLKSRPRPGCGARQDNATTHVVRWRSQLQQATFYQCITY